jgi:flagellar motor switch protein FliM
MSERTRGAAAGSSDGIPTGEGSRTAPGGRLISTAVRKPGTDVSLKLYDFKRPDKFSKDRIMTLAILHETFARLATAGLSAFLEADITLTEYSVDQLTYGEFLAAGDERARFVIVTLSPLPGAAVFRLSPVLCAKLVDRTAGGTGETELERGELTGAETVLVRLPFEKLLESYAEAWSGLAGLCPGVASVEWHSRYAGIVPPSEMAVYVEFDFSFNGHTSRLELCIPYLTLEPTLRALAVGGRPDAAREGGSIPVASLPIECALYYETEPLSLRDLLSVTRGKPVRLPGYEAGSAFLEAGGKPVLRLTREGDPPVSGYSVAGAETDAAKREARLLRPGGGQDRDEASAGELSKRLEECLERLSEVMKFFSGRADRPAAGDRLPGNGSRDDTAPRRLSDLVRPSDVERLHLLLKDDQPQVVALVLFLVGPETSAALLARFGEELRTELVLRLSGIRRPIPEAARRLGGYLASRLEEFQRRDGAPDAGLERVREILRTAPAELSHSILGSLERCDPALAGLLSRKGPMPGQEPAGQGAGTDLGA